MRDYSNVISLTKTSRGVYCLDPFKGCSNGMKENPKGCYSACYSARIAKGKGWNFNKTMYRYFEDNIHYKHILEQLAKLQYIRMGCHCDPSHDWNHTMVIISDIKAVIKDIVIVTKHWNIIPDNELKYLKNLTINTSISALDTPEQIEIRYLQYLRLKPYCNSVLRVNTCDFNDERLNKKQNELLSNMNVIDTALRLPKTHKLVIDGTINIQDYMYLKKRQTISKHDNNIHTGNCKNCLDKCGLKYKYGFKELQTRLYL